MQRQQEIGQIGSDHESTALVVRPEFPGFLNRRRRVPALVMLGKIPGIYLDRLAVASVIASQPQMVVGLGRALPGAFCRRRRTGQQGQREDSRFSANRLLHDAASAVYQCAKAYALPGGRLCASTQTAAVDPRFGVISAADSSPRGASACFSKAIGFKIRSLNG